MSRFCMNLVIDEGVYTEDVNILSMLVKEVEGFNLIDNILDSVTLPKFNEELLDSMIFIPDNQKQIIRESFDNLFYLLNTIIDLDSVFYAKVSKDSSDSALIIIYFEYTQTSTKNYNKILAAKMLQQKNDNVKRQKCLLEEFVNNYKDDFSFHRVSKKVYDSKHNVGTLAIEIKNKYTTSIIEECASAILESFKCMKFLKVYNDKEPHFKIKSLSKSVKHIIVYGGGGSSREYNYDIVDNIAHNINYIIPLKMLSLDMTVSIQLKDYTVILAENIYVMKNIIKYINSSMKFKILDSHYPISVHPATYEDYRKLISSCINNRTRTIICNYPIEYYDSDSDYGFFSYY